MADDPNFGGFSGIELSDDGRRFYALSDRGHLATGTISRTDGRISDVTLEGIVRLRGRARVDETSAVDGLSDDEKERLRRILED